MACAGCRTTRGAASGSAAGATAARPGNVHAPMEGRRFSFADGRRPGADVQRPIVSAECHSLGKVGGALERRKNNVDLLSLLLPAHKEKLDAKKFHDRMTEFHPAFTSGTASVLRSASLTLATKFSNTPEYGEWLKLMKRRSRTESGRRRLAGREATIVESESTRASQCGPNEAGRDALSTILPPPKATPAPVKFQLTHRNTPGAIRRRPDRYDSR